MEPKGIATKFVDSSALLLAVNLSNEIDPLLAAYLPAEVPEADGLLDDDVLLGQLLRAKREDHRGASAAAVHWFSAVWLELPSWRQFTRDILAELDRARFLPTILDLEGAVATAAEYLDRHFKPAELARWDPHEPTYLLRGRYPLIRRQDVLAHVEAALCGQTASPA